MGHKKLKAAEEELGSTEQLWQADTLPELLQEAAVVRQTVYKQVEEKHGNKFHR